MKVSDLESDLDEAYACLGRVVSLKVAINGVSASSCENMVWQIEEARDFLIEKGLYEKYTGMKP